ncbi:YqxA family protein [Lederbergia panacisoli]|uniref:YqxA family protein n=1 Tax=Lederbergia panacisoli TaxID=1255251 RepID=UPI00214AB928|nr:YqxA family protein [Lederbergia panacisoli]MCR2820456.1 YqxA family protein [Lederbergia panacisoli]
MMRNFIFKCMILVGVLFIGVLIGMNKANEGMLNMKGYSDHSFQTPVTVQQNDNGEVETTFMGKNLPSFNLEERKEKLEEAKAYNLFSETGKFLADIVTSTTQKVFGFLSSLL